MRVTVTIHDLPTNISAMMERKKVAREKNLPCLLHIMFSYDLSLYIKFLGYKIDDEFSFKYHIKAYGETLVLKTKYKLKKIQKSNKEYSRREI